MDQVHKRFTAEQVRVLLKGYCQGTLDRLAIEEILGIGKTSFFAPGPRYFITEAWEMNTAIAPAMKKAGTKQVSTCAERYSSSAFNPPCSNSMKTAM